MQLAEWNQPLVWIALGTLAMFVGSIAIVWISIICLPVDYLTSEERSTSRWAVQHPVVRWLLVVLKNICGLALVITGTIMLLTPGQGVLCIVLGLGLVDFPGKRRVVRRALGRPRTLKTINRIRAKAKRAPLQVPV